MALDEATVRKIAKLARIKVPENEVPTLAEDCLLYTSDAADE